MLTKTFVSISENFISDIVSILESDSGLCRGVVCDVVTSECSVRMSRFRRATVFMQTSFYRAGGCTPHF